MTPQTMTALRASIAHHESNLNAESPGDVKLGTDECALCAMFLGEFNKEPAEHCVGCPVRERTKEKHCNATPYHQLANCAAFWDCNPSSANRDAFLAAERAEIAFLKSLLPDVAK